MFCKICFMVCASVLLTTTSFAKGKNIKEITADTLSQAYQQNELRAAKLYDNKTFMISGKVISIHNNGCSIFWPGVSIRVGGPMHCVGTKCLDVNFTQVCFGFEESNNKLESLLGGEILLAKCNIRGLNMSGIVNADCVTVETYSRADILKSVINQERE